MPQILIIEDEQPAAKRLKKLITRLDDSIEIVAVIDSVEDAVSWFKNFGEPDLAFFDIQLADGLSFSVFEQIEIKCPVIFTTAYDEYALKAFKVNSIDYLLKPIEPEELESAWSKYRSLSSSAKPDFMKMLSEFQGMNQKRNFRERFLIKKGDGYQYLTINEVSYFLSDGGLTFLIDKKGKRFIVDEKMDGLENTLNPRKFFRINRKFIIAENAVSKISNYFNSRLKLELSPTFDEDVIVARDRVSDFKGWLSE